jgi:prevent-host-death family protein
MATYGVAEAKNNFTHLLERVEDGERILITRHGKLVAEIIKAPAVEPAKPPLAAKDFDAIMEDLRRVRESLPPAHMPAADMIRQLRDEGL